MVDRLLPAAAPWWPLHHSPCLLSCCAARPASRRFLHPIQVVNAKEAGAAGILGVIGVWHACLSHT